MGWLSEKERKMKNQPQNARSAMQKNVQNETQERFKQYKNIFKDLHLFNISKLSKISGMDYQTGILDVHFVFFKLELFISCMDILMDLLHFISCLVLIHFVWNIFMLDLMLKHYDI